MLTAALALLGSLLSGVDRVDYAAEVSTALRVRTAEPLEPAGGRNGEFQLSPSLRLNVADGPTTAQLAYGPQLLWAATEAVSPWKPTLLHVGQLRLRSSVSPHRFVVLEQQLLYGLRDISPLNQETPSEGASPPETEPLDRLVGARVIRYLESGSWLEGGYGVSPTLMLSGRAGYLVSGGADAAAQRVLPRQSGPSATARARWGLSSTGALTFSGTGSYTRFSAGPNIVLAEGNAGWEDAPGRALRTELWGGAAAFRVQSLGLAATGALPLAGARVSYSAPIWGQRWTQSAQLELTPRVDPYTGAVYDRAEAGTSAEYAPNSRLSLTATASGALPVGSAEYRGERSAFAQLAAAYRLSREVRLNTGGRIAWFSAPQLLEGISNQWLVFAGLDARTTGVF